MPRVAQVLQASLAKAGFTVKFVPVTQSNFYGSYLLNPSIASSSMSDCRSARATSLPPTRQIVKDLQRQPHRLLTSRSTAHR